MTVHALNIHMKDHGTCILMIKNQGNGEKQ